LAPTEVGRCATAITGRTYALRALAIGARKRPGAREIARAVIAVTAVTAEAVLTATATLPPKKIFFAYARARKLVKRDGRMM